MRSEDEKRFFASVHDGGGDMERSEMSAMGKEASILPPFSREVWIWILPLEEPEIEPSRRVPFLNFTKSEAGAEGDVKKNGRNAR